MAPRGPVGAVLLAPGAGSDRDHPTLVALEEALAPRPVRRMDFPYRREGRRAPDRPPVLLAALAAEVAALRADARVAPRRILLGGRSMGGRMCSVLVADGQQAAGLLLISYPLHPPGKPDRLRVDHFGRIGVPVLFVSGDRDPFGSPGELEAAGAAIAGPVTYCWIPGGRHDLKGAEDRIVAATRDWLAGLGGAPVTG